MTTIQKIIKNLAIALAIFLSVNIISGIVFGVLSIIGISNFIDKVEDSVENKIENVERTEMKTISDSIENIKKLEIELGVSNLEIKESETFKIDTNNPNIEYLNKNGDIKLKEKSKLLNFNKDNIENKVVVYIPKQSEILKELEIETGAGEANVSNMEVEKFSYEQGAGKTTINNIKVYKESEIKGGTGELKINESTLNNLELELGVGSLDLNGQLEGNNKIKSGIGKVDIRLIDGIANYKVEAYKGIGEINIKGKTILDDEIIGQGINKLKIEGGIGNINIK